MIKFSVIVPLYNCEKYIKECIDSILNQRYPYFELLIINDGSTDNSRKIVQSYQDNRIRIIDKENGGLLHARLTGLQEASNDYIVFVDADDRILITLLEDLVPFFESGYDCVVYKLREFIEDRKREEFKGLFNNKTIFEENEKLLLLQKLLTTGSINSIVYKSFNKKLVNIKEMVTYPRVSIGEDALFTLQLFKNYAKLIYLDKSYYEYRQFNGSMTHRLRFSNYTDNVFRFNLYYETVNQYFNTNGVEIIDKVDRLFFKMVLSILLNPKARLGSKTEYRTIVEKISSDSLFKQKFQNAYGKQNIFYKEILRSINKKRVNRLLFYRFILRIVFKIAKRGLE